MLRILHIDSSPRAERSISRALSRQLVSAWQEVDPDVTVTYRDLGHQPVPHVDEPWIAAAFSSSDQRTSELSEALRLSNELVDEFVAADYYVFGVPMYNFSVPSTFKAYVDQIVRVGRTFTINSTDYTGLVKDKKMVIITTQGGNFRPGASLGSWNFHEPYLRMIFGFIGITDINFIYADSLMMGGEVREQSIADAKAAIQAVISAR